MSHLPIKPVDYYLDKLSNKRVLTVGGIAIVVLILFGGKISNLLMGVPYTAAKVGELSEHYADGIIRTATTPFSEDDLAKGLYSTNPFVIPPYQDDYLIPKQ